MAASPPTPFQMTRLIVMSLAGGVLLFWTVAWFVTGGGASGVAPDVLPGALALIVWAAVALPAFGGALYFRARAASGATSGTAGAGGTGRVDASASRTAQTSTIVAQALLEGPALLGGVFFLLLGTTPVVWVALPVYLLGLALTWPSADWFPGAGT